jgi:hypothetical protein
MELGGGKGSVPAMFCLVGVRVSVGSHIEVCLGECCVRRVGFGQRVIWGCTQACSGRHASVLYCTPSLLVSLLRHFMLYVVRRLIMAEEKE